MPKRQQTTPLTIVNIWDTKSVTQEIVVEFAVSHTFRKISDIKRTKSHNLNDSRLFLHLSLPNLLKLGVKSRMKMYIWVINNLIVY